MLLHHRFSTIYSEAHGLTFATDPMFTDMHSKIVAKFDKDFLQVGKGLINQQAKVALVRLSNGNEDLRRSYFSEFATFIMRPIDNDYDFNDIKFKPSKLWTLCDDLCYNSIKGSLLALHKNPAGARGASAITRRASMFTLFMRSIGPSQDRDEDRHPIQHEASRSPNYRNTKYEVLQVGVAAQC